MFTKMLTSALNDMQVLNFCVTATKLFYFGICLFKMTINQTYLIINLLLIYANLKTFSIFFLNLIKFY